MVEFFLTGANGDEMGPFVLDVDDQPHEGWTSFSAPDGTVWYTSPARLWEPTN